MTLYLLEGHNTKLQDVKIPGHFPLVLLVTQTKCKVQKNYIYYQLTALVNRYEIITPICFGYWYQPSSRNTRTQIEVYSVKT